MLETWLSNERLLLNSTPRLCDLCQWLQLHAANGTLILYVGYIELDIELCCQVIPGCGVLVVRDAPGGTSAQVSGISPLCWLKRRMCVDYRQLNAKTRKDAFPLPRIEETLDSLTGARWFSTMDLASGYNQIPVTEGDKHKTAFCTPFGLFEWNRMPFGLCNAPSTFQRLMERVFGDQQCQSLLLYLDDIVVFSSSVTQHLERLEVVLSWLER